MQNITSIPNGSSEELQRQADKLKAEFATIEARMKRRRKKFNEREQADISRKNRIREALRRLEVVPLLGKPDAVQIRHRHSEGKAARLNDCEFPWRSASVVIPSRRTAAGRRNAGHGN